MEKTEKTDKAVLRNKSIGTKVSEDEYAALEKLAEARGLTLSEWFRELVLAELIAHPAEQVILAEVLALRMLYLNTVQILGRGRELTTEGGPGKAGDGAGGDVPRLADQHAARSHEVPDADPLDCASLSVLDYLAPQRRTSRNALLRPSRWQRFFNNVTHS
ncbi:MAG: plasmid mobilization protein [Terriglobales bacterium]